MPPPDPPKDPLVEAQIERALRPYLGIAHPRMLATMRAILEEALTTHPIAVQLLNRQRGHAMVQESGEMGREGADEHDTHGDDRATGGDKRGA